MAKMKTKIDYEHPEQLKKEEFCEIIAEKSGLNKKEAKAAVNAFVETVKEEVGAGRYINFLNFGTFKVAHRNARKGRNPQTGEPIDIAASDSLVFHSKIKY